MPKPPLPSQGPIIVNVTVTNFVPIPSTPPTDGTPTYPSGFFSDATFELDGGTTVRPSSRNSWLTIDTTRNAATGRPFVTVCKGVGNDHNKRVVLEKGIILHFTILGAGGQTDTYKALDISFVQYEPSTRSNDDPDGSLTFPQSSVSIPPATLQPGEVGSNNTLEVYNLWTGHNGNPNDPTNPGGKDFKWRFFLLIQRNSDSAIGIIDPDLQNEN